LAVKAAQTGHRIAFATAVDWVARLKVAHNAGRLPAALVKLRRIGLLVVDLCRTDNYADPSPSRYAKCLVNVG
jgi:DNA replication protein DnaC